MKLSKSLRTFLAISAITIAISPPIQAQKTKINGIEVVTLADIEMAELTLGKAIKVKNVWRDTEKLIASAKEAVQKKDFTTARDLATEALYQAELAYKQAIKQKNNLEFPEYLK